MAAAAAGSSAAHSFVTSISLARRPTHASLSSSRDSNPALSSHSSAEDPGACLVASPVASPPPRWSQTEDASRSAATAPSGSAWLPDDGALRCCSPRCCDDSCCFRCCAAPQTPLCAAFSGFTNVPGSSAPEPRNSAGHAWTAAPSTSSEGYTVSPRSASRNAARNPRSSSVDPWFVASVATVSVSRTTYSSSSDPGSAAGAARTRDAATPKERHIPAKPFTTASASEAASACAASREFPEAASPPPPSPSRRARIASLMASPRRRDATCRRTSHAGARNSAEERKWPHASRMPLRATDASGAHSPYTAAAESDAETAAAWRFARAASPALENDSADEKCT